MYINFRNQLDGYEIWEYNDEWRIIISTFDEKADS